MTTFDNEMTNTQFTYHKNKLTKWLLTVTLLFSIFTFSGYVGNSQSKNQQATQTELVISSNHKTCKRPILYKKASEFACNPFLTNPLKAWQNTLLSHNQQSKLKFNNISRKFSSYKSADHFLHLKTIPQNSDEDLFATFIG